MPTKTLFQSKTFWAVFFNIVLKLVGLFFAVNSDPQTIEMMSDTAIAAAAFFPSFVLDLIAIYGRATAKTKISR